MFNNSELTPCANLLYHWLLIHNHHNKAIAFDYKAFQIWTTEFFPTCVSKDEIIEAISTLKKLNLIFLKNKLIEINPYRNRSNTKINNLPQCFLPVTKQIEKVKNKDNSWQTRLIMISSLLVLWGGTCALSVRMALSSPDSMTSTTPYHVLNNKNN